jgi:copper chaperone CopZ
MKKIIIEGMNCQGCANDVFNILSGIYGLTSITVSYKEGHAMFDGFVSKEIIANALAQRGYRLVELIKM